MKYKVHVGEDEYVDIPRDVINNIIRDYLSNKYYISVGIGMFVIGFLLGVVA